MSRTDDDLPEILISDVGSHADRAALRAAVHEFNFAATGFRDDRDLSCFLRNGDRVLVAGIDGFTWGGYARVEYLWVDQPLRGTGVGSRLLSAAEDEARDRGCRKIVLDTFSFQAPDFYRARGYAEVGTTSDTPVGFSQTLFEKRL